MSGTSSTTSSASSSSLDRDQFEEGLGSVTWWGFSPARAVWDKKRPSCSAGSENDDESDHLKVLLLGAGDGRHIVHSMAAGEEEVNQDCTFKLHFYVYEQNILLYARQMLFLSLLQEVRHKKESELELSVKTFLEILGNVSLSQQSADALRTVAYKIRRDLRRLQAIDSGEVDREYPLLDISRLKRRELDMLVDLFTLWSREPTDEEGETNNDDEAGVGREEDPIKAELPLFWDARLRQLLKDRYDVKDGLFEMDYQLRLVERGGASISHKEYCHWRKTGDAFNLFNHVDLDESPRVSNLTLASGLVLRRGKTNSASKRGYCGDVVTGPFVCYGFEYSTEVHMTRTKSERMAQDRAVKYLTKVVRRVWNGRERDVASQFPKVTFLSVSSAERDLMRKAKFAKTFHSVFVACSVTHFLQAPLISNLINGGPVFVESPRFLIHLANSVQDKFADHLKSSCQQIGLQMKEEQQNEEGEVGGMNTIFHLVKNS